MPNGVAEMTPLGAITNASDANNLLAHGRITSQEYKQYMAQFNAPAQLQPSTTNPITGQQLYYNPTTGANQPSPDPNWQAPSAQQLLPNIPQNLMNAPPPALPAVPNNVSLQPPLPPQNSTPAQSQAPVVMPAMPQTPSPQIPIQQQPMQSIPQTVPSQPVSQVPCPDCPPGQSAPASLEQQALNGGGAGNKQQISNFMSALNNVGAGSNNTFMNSGQTTAPTTNPLISPQAAYTNNGSAGTLSSTPNYNTNVNQPTSGASSSSSMNTSEVTPNNPNVYGTTLTGQPININAPNYNTLASDETLKTNVTPSDNKLKDFMATIGAHSYQYKNPEIDGKGTFVSPMAQELEKTDLGKQAVIDTPRGKMVNYPRLGAVNLAGLSVVHQENQKLQDKVDRLQSQFEALKKGFKL